MVNYNDARIYELTSIEEYDGLDELVVLGRIQDSSSVKPLEEFFADKDPRVKISVVDALAMIRDKSVDPSILPLIKNEDPSFRHYAIKALGPFIDNDVLPQLEEHSEKDVQISIHDEAIESVKNIEEMR